MKKKKRICFSELGDEIRQRNSHYFDVKRSPIDGEKKMFLSVLCQTFGECEKFRGEQRNISV